MAVATFSITKTNANVNKNSATSAGSAATVIAARKLAASGWIKPGETVVLFNTGTGYKYSEAWEKALGN